MYSEETPCKEKLLYDVVTSNVISDCAEIIRNELLNFKNPFPSWPPTQSELLTCNGSIPPYLEKLLLGIISSNTEKTERKLRIVSSIGQDLIYKATWGEKKTCPAGCFNKAENWIKKSDSMVEEIWSLSVLQRNQS